MSYIQREKQKEKKKKRERERDHDVLTDRHTDIDKQNRTTNRAITQTNRDIDIYIQTKLEERNKERHRRRQKLT